MKIKKVVLSPGTTGFYFDDQVAIKHGAGHDGLFYVGEPETEGFTAIRQAGESIGVQLILDDGQVALGECAAVQYSGAGGRDPLFLAEDFIPFIEENLVPELEGKEITTWLELSKEVDEKQVNGQRLHTAIRYGLSQAFLDAVAKKEKLTRAEVVHNEMGVTEPIERCDVFTQSGDDRYDNADKMIIKQADVLPHGLFNNVEEKLGQNGEKLKDYVQWLVDRIDNNKQSEDYKPVLHIDVYGTIGEAFDLDTEKMANYLEELEEIAKPYHLRIEGPMDAGSKEAQIEAMQALTKAVDERGINVELVADEWCNTLEDVKDFVDADAGHMIQVKTPDLGAIHNSAEAILYCKENGKGAYSGGTCNETNVSAEILTNVAMACGADQVLAKPGMGVDEGLMIVGNEMNRVMALIENR